VLNFNIKKCFFNISAASWVKNYSKKNPIIADEDLKKGSELLSHKIAVPLTLAGLTSLFGIIFTLFFLKIIQKKILIISDKDFKERQRSTLPQDCSTIDAGGLNFSVRDGKR
jgi:hypothetical protein